MGALKSAFSHKRHVMTKESDESSNNILINALTWLGSTCLFIGLFEVIGGVEIIPVEYRFKYVGLAMFGISAVLLYYPIKNISNDLKKEAKST